MIQHWFTKFRNAFRGLYHGSVGESSFAVHVLAACLVLIAAAVLACDLWEWCLLLLCIGLVFTCELLNSSIESLAKGLCQEDNEHVGRALDIASGAVLCISIFAALVGILILGPKILPLG